MKSILITLAATLIACTANAADQHQVCNGVLIKDEEGYLLKPDAGSSLWCDAYIDGDFGDASVSRVLEVCAVGRRCHIEGSFTGHGVFYWRHVSLAFSMP
jgi:hypothetical protein